MKSIPIHIQIIIGLIIGLLFGIASIQFNWDPSFTINYIKPFGTIFINSLKMIAVPLVLASLIVGVANIGDISKLSRVGGKTISLYLITTVIAVSTGLVMVNIIKPGNKLPEQTRESLMELYGSDVESSASVLGELKKQGPLQPLVDIVPENIFESASDNSSMLQVVFFCPYYRGCLTTNSQEKGRACHTIF